MHASQEDLGTMHSSPGSLAAIAILATAFVGACEPTNQGYAPSQPIAFSHATHAGTNQVACQYCHYTAERSRHAGFPPAGVCLNCHTQILATSPEIQKVRNAIATRRPIPWTRVHVLPDFAYFNHAAHVQGSVACQTCHGPVETMATIEQTAPLTMGFCLDCHRQQTQFAQPCDVASANRLTDCVVCHH